MNTQLDSLIAREFSLDPDVFYLNHAAVAPWPARTAAAVTAFAAENAHRGAQNYPGWLRREAELRELCRDLVNAPSVDDIALVKNTSEALSFVAHGIAWQPGDNVVLCDLEFPSNRIVWESLIPLGVEVRIAETADKPPEDAMIQLMDRNTRLLSSSSVQYGTGLRMDLQRLGSACRDHGAAFCVDAIQSLGALPFDLQAIGADFVMADGHKWMLGAEGLGLFYCSVEWRERLSLHQYGWHMTEQYSNFDAIEWQPAASARRFECGSPNMLGVQALHASLSLLLEIGMTQVENRLLQNSSRLIELIDTAPGLELISSTEPSRRSGIVTFRKPTEPSDRLFARLRDAGVICAPRGGGIRFSSHFYTPTEVLEKAVALVVAD
ncbi:MAG: aminotransferase class V-fold PLP-dependent enzyme [Gammaproteobacteria bacterium]|nr:aminotransferase class V-fold PLP-dependent enzyme [Gammaproteobacteria bacterium]